MATTDPVPDVLGRLGCDRTWFGAMLVVAACTHAAVAWALERAPSHRLPARTPIQVVDIEIPPPPPPPLEAPAPEPPKPESVMPPAPRAVRAAPQPPPLAPAAAVITRRADDSEPLDFGGFVVGSASTYVGGATAANGTGTSATAGVPVGPAAMPPPSPRSIERGPDRSRRPAVAGGLEWRCPFPPEADAEGIDDAVATIRIDVAVSGAVRSVSIQSDPGHGFGREARRCALTKAWTPALDREGSAVDGTAVVKVRFTR
jgi:protein TonB